MSKIGIFLTKYDSESSNLTGVLQHATRHYDLNFGVTANMSSKTVVNRDFSLYAILYYEAGNTIEQQVVQDISNYIKRQATSVLDVQNFITIEVYTADFQEMTSDSMYCLVYPRV